MIRQAAFEAIGHRVQAVGDLNVTTADCELLQLGESACERLFNITSRARSRLDVDNDGDVDARDFALRLRMVGDLNVTAADCAALELSQSDCARLQNITSRVHSRLDVDNDGDVDGNDVQARLRAFADLNLTAAECITLEIGADDCSRLQNATARARSRLDVDNDGDVDAEDFALRFRAIGDLNITSFDCASLELTSLQCLGLRNFTLRIRSRLDVDNDGDVDDVDRRARFRMIADLNVTAADCRTLELSEQGYVAKRYVTLHDVT